MMLFNDKYKIESDKLNVTISVKTNNTKKIKVDGVQVDTDEVIYSPIGYFSTMTSAITWLYDYLLKKKSKEAKDVKELKIAIEECKNEIIKEVSKYE